MIKEYNKIVRDKIPEIIEASGKKCKYTTPSSTDIPYEEKALCRKLHEELTEFENTFYVKEELEELGDIIDVCYAIAKYLGCSSAALDDLRNKKSLEKGGFDKLIYLRTVED